MNTIDGIKLMNLQRKWYGKDGVIYFDIAASLDITGHQWILRLKEKGYRFSDCAKSVIYSDGFKTTPGVTIKIVVLKGILFEYWNRTIEKISADADKREWGKPDAEAACLIREMFTDEEIRAMGLQRIIVMSEPINDSRGVPRLLGVNGGGHGRLLSAYRVKPDLKWGDHVGFAFVESFVYNATK